MGKTDFYELWGLKKPEEEPPQEPEPQQEPDLQMQQEPEPQPIDDPEPPQEPEPQQDPDPEPKGPTEEELEARRQQELEEARREAREQVRAEMQKQQEERERAFFQRAQLKNQYDPENPVICTMAQFDAWFDQHQAKRMEQQLRNGQLTPEMLDQAAKRAMDARMAAEPAQEVPTAEQVQQEQQERFQQQVAWELAEIQKIDPAMTSIKAVLDSPMGDDFRSAVQDGSSFLAAFKTAKQLAGYKATAKKAAVRANDVGSKQHLQTHRGASGAPAGREVPAATMEHYRRLHPSWTAEQIRQNYNKWYK